MARAARLALSTTLLAGTTAPVWSQQAPATTLPTVTVRDSAVSTAPSEGSSSFGVRASNTATGLDLSLRETPQSVSVVPRAQIEAFGLTDARDLLSHVTGVNVEKVETDRTYFSARGFDITNFQEDGIGMPFATGLLHGDMDTAVYDRVEVLRGANGLLSSTGNPSATVNFVRKRPTRAFQASAGLTLGSWQQQRLEGDVSGALNDSGSVRGRVVLVHEDKDSYLDRYRSGKQVFSGVLEADLGTATVLTVGHTQQNNRPKGLMWGALPLYDSAGAAIAYDVSASSAPAWAKWDTDDARSFAELRHELGGGWTAKAAVNHRRVDAESAMLYVYGTPDATTGAGLFSWPSIYRHNERQTQVDAQVSGPFTLAGRRHEALVGLNSGRNRVDMTSSYDGVGLPLTLQAVLDGNFAKPAFDQGVSAYGERVDKRHTAYAAGKFVLSDALKLIAGLNVTRASSAGVQYGTPHNYAATETQPFAGLVLDVHPNVSVYGSAAGIFNPQIELDANDRVLDPIKGRSLEAGLKFESTDKAFNASLAAFRVRQDNTAEAAGFSSGRTYYRGVDAQSTGFEIDMAGTLAPGWQISAGFTQLRIQGENGEDVRTYVPRRTFRLSTTVAVPAVAGLDVGAGVRWQSAISRDQGAGVVTRQKAYAVVDAMVRYALNRQWSLTANLHNLTDEKYLNSLLWDQNYYAAPRSLSVTLNWKH